MDGRADQLDAAGNPQVHDLFAALPADIRRTAPHGVMRDENVVHLVGARREADARVLMVLRHGLHDQGPLLPVVRRLGVDDYGDRRGGPMVTLIYQEIPGLKLHNTQSKSVNHGNYSFITDKKNTQSKSNSNNLL